MARTRQPRPAPRFMTPLSVAGVLLALLLIPALPAQPPDPLDSEFTTRHLPVLQEYCYPCHGDGRAKGDISLDPYDSLAAVRGDKFEWLYVYDVLRDRSMPPDDMPQPTAEQRDRLIRWIEQALDLSAEPEPAETPAPAATPEPKPTPVPIDPASIPFDPDADSPEAQFAANVQPLLEAYCYSCHGNGRSRGGLALDAFTSAASLAESRETWTTIQNYIESRHMPPDTATQPTPFQRDYLADWLRQQLFPIDPDNPDPGRVVMHRLNRAEYNATIRDLVGVDFQPAEDFPRDDSGYGFDNIAAVLSLSPLLMEKYLDAADKILDTAIQSDPIRSRVRRLPASQAEVAFNALGDRGDGWIQLISLENDDVAYEIDTVPGDYIFRVMAMALPGKGLMPGGGRNYFLEVDDPQPLQMTIMLGNTIVAVHDNITSDTDNPQVYETRIGSPGGRQRFRAVNHRIRGGENEKIMINGKIGAQQDGMLLVNWLEIEGPLPAQTTVFTPRQFDVNENAGHFTSKGDWLQYARGTASVEIEVEEQARHIIRVEAFASKAGDDVAKMDLLLNGERLETFAVDAPDRLKPTPDMKLFSIVLLDEVPGIYQTTTTLPPGRHRLGMAFTNDLTDRDSDDPNRRDRNLAIRSLQVVNLERPLSGPPMPEPIARLFARHPAETPDSARALIAGFARRAWRRPVAPAELDQLMRLYSLARDEGDTHKAGVKLAMKAALISPNFLYRGIPHPTEAVTQPVRPLNEFELATRLSYFLWSSMFDDELFTLAERSELRANLPAQIRRMIADPKSSALVENFAGQWLQFRALNSVAPDLDMFPEFNGGIRDAMARETALFFESVMRDNTSMLDFLNDDYTFVNETLADLYEIDGVTGDEFQRVSLVGTHRSGVLTHGSILTLTSNPTRTSPVKRGKWVLENLLGSPPPPPPPDVPELENDGKPLTGTLREQMEKHRDNPNCSSCHARMDPIGFGLENFDAIGRWRTRDGKFVIESTGELVTGERFMGATELSLILARKRADDFVRCLSDKMLTYALGRGLEYYDRPALDQVAARVEAGDYRFESLIVAIAESFPFQHTRTESFEPETGPDPSSNAGQITQTPSPPQTASHSIESEPIAAWAKQVASAAGGW